MVPCLQFRYPLDFVAAATKSILPLVADALATPLDGATSISFLLTFFPCSTSLPWKFGISRCISSFVHSLYINLAVLPLWEGNGLLKIHHGRNISSGSSVPCQAIPEWEATAASLHPPPMSLHTANILTHLLLAGLAYSPASPLRVSNMQLKGTDGISPGLLCIWEQPAGTKILAKSDV